MHFTIVDKITNVQTIATGKGIRELRRLSKVYGPGRWRKRKGLTRIRLSDGTLCRAEVHWYEAHGIGAKEYKIKTIVDWEI